VTDPTPTKSWPRDALPRLTLLHGYRIVDILGRGGFGITYKAVDGIDQKFAIKEYFPRQFAVRQGMDVLPPDDAAREMFDECLDRFTREARALTLFSGQAGGGEGVVRVITYFQANGTAYIVMEYLEGETFDRVIAAHPEGLSEAELMQILRTLLPALGRVHANGLLHRDIKPANIFLRDSTHPVLLDFGAARTSTGNTEAYTSIFTESYAPIEQIEGRKQGPYSDIYALGVTCYKAIAGRTTDSAGTMSLTRQAALLRLQPDPLRPASELGAGRYSKKFLDGIDAALRVAPEERPQDVSAFASAIGLDETPAAVAAPAAPPVQTPAPPAPAAADATRLFAAHVAAAPEPATARETPTVVATKVEAARAISPTEINPPTVRIAGGGAAAAAVAAPAGVPARGGSGLIALLGSVVLLAAVAGGGYVFWPQLRKLVPLTAPAPTPVPLPPVQAPPKPSVQPPPVATRPPPVMQTPPPPVSPPPYADAAADAAYKAADFVTALPAYKTLAEQGDRHAQTRLGTMFLNGEGVPKDVSAAIEWYQKAAAKNFAPAEDQLGRIFLNGLAGAPDYAAAVQWYQQAAAQNFAHSEYVLGVMAQRGLGMRRDFPTMLDWYRRAAAHGSADAAQQLGYAYQEGLGVTISLPQAASWYRIAAERGSPEGMFSLGQMYFGGLGLTKDQNVGRDWIARAAESGNGEARKWLHAH
jgi:tetratricopeptide (TPR) repeat protein